MPRGTPSTQINITLGAEGLSEKAAMLQSAARQAQIEKERTQRIAAEGAEKREANQAAKGRAADGSSLYSNSPNVPQIDRRPAAQRSGQGLDLGHLWLFRDTFQSTFSTGIREITGSSGRSRTGTDLRGQKQDVLLGCGDGTQWETFAGLGTDTAPNVPAETFTVEYISPPPTFLPAPSNFERSHIGPRLSGRSVNSSWQDYYLALPCGNKKFIFVYGYSSVWDTYQSNAYYAARASYDKDTGEFIGFFDLATGGYTSNTIPDDLMGASYGDNLTGVIGFEGYTGKNRKFSAYICDNKSMRQIQIPALMQNILDTAYPEPIATTRTISYRINVSFTYDRFALAPITNGLYDDENGYSNNYNGSVYTPSIFELINDLNQFVNPSAIKAFPKKLEWGLSDSSEGAYVKFQDWDTGPDFPYWSDMYREGLPFYHALWINKNEKPDLSIWDPDYAEYWANSPKPKRQARSTLNLSSARASRTGATDRPSLPGAYWYEDFITVWDWDDPAYCRTMCKALGFTEADLTP